MPASAGLMAAVERRRRRDAGHRRPRQCRADVRRYDRSKAYAAHLNRVPALLFNAPPDVHSLGDGKLADMAPTLLALMKLPQPAEMTGHSLLSPQSRAAILAVPHPAVSVSA